MKQTNIEKLIETYDNYIKLLGEEINETIIIAVLHGWKSKRVELGFICREEISLLKEQLQQEEPRMYTQEEMDKEKEESYWNGYNSFGA